MAHDKVGKQSELWVRSLASRVLRVPAGHDVLPFRPVSSVFSSELDVGIQLAFTSQGAGLLGAAYTEAVGLEPTNFRSSGLGSRWFFFNQSGRVFLPFRLFCCLVKRNIAKERIKERFRAQTQ